MKVEVETWERKGRWDWRIVAEGVTVDNGVGFVDDNQALQVGLRRAAKMFNRSGR